MELDIIYNENCVGKNGMAKIPDNSIDLIFCDLPYGTTQSAWDSLIPFDKMWPEYERITKENGVILLFAKSPFDKVLACSNQRLYKYEWIWEKNKSTGHLNAKKMPMQAHENILVFYKKPPTYNPQMSDGHKPMNYAKGNHKSTVYGKGKSVENQAGTTQRYPRTILKFGVVNNDDPERIHPNQKPVDLCEYLIKTYTNEEAVVLDNCVGSGTIPIACINTNRHYIGFEWNEKNPREFYDKAIARIEKHKNKNQIKG